MAFRGLRLPILLPCLFLLLLTTTPSDGDLRLRGVRGDTISRHTGFHVPRTSTLPQLSSLSPSLSPPPPSAPLPLLLLEARTAATARRRSSRHAQKWQRTGGNGFAGGSDGKGDEPGQPGSGVPVSGDPLSKKNKDVEVGGTVTCARSLLLCTHSTPPLALAAGVQLIPRTPLRPLMRLVPGIASCDGPKRFAPCARLHSFVGLFVELRPLHSLHSAPLLTSRSSFRSTALFFAPPFSPHSATPPRSLHSAPPSAAPDYIDGKQYKDEDKGKGFLVDGRPYKYRCKDALRGKGSCKELKDDNPQGKEDREYDDVTAGNMKLTYGKEVAQGPLADGNFDGGPSYVPSTPRAQWAASIVAPKKEKPPASPFHMHQVLGSSYPVPIHPNHKAGNGVPINSDTLQVPKDKKGNIYGQSPSSFAGGTDNSAAATSMPVQPGFPDQKVRVYLYYLYL